MIMSSSFIKSFLCVSFACAAAFLLGSCQSSTPASRIAANPAVFQSLPAEQQQLVQQGKICAGMNKEAVMLAWGTPGGAMAGQRDGKMLETWRYTQMVPVYTPHFYSFHCYGPYSHGPYYYDDWFYIPRTAAEVTFRDGKVTGWQSLQKVR